MDRTASQFVGLQSSNNDFVTDFIDRWIYVFMASLFVATVLAGFIPDSINKLAAVQSAQRPPFPLILHVHALLMGAWLVLVLAQTTLMAAGRASAHKQLGMLGMLIAPAMVIAGLILIPTMYYQSWDVLHNATPDLKAALEPKFKLQSSFVSQQFRDGLLFSILIATGLSFRRSDLQTHKRLMILGTAMLLPAGIGRIPWLPTTMPGSTLSLELYSLLLISPMFLWDLIRLRQVHRAYLIWLVIYVPIAIANVLIWGKDWWLALVPGIMGMNG